MDGRITLTVELWFESEPQLDRDALVAAVPGADPVGDPDVLMLAHPRFVHEYPDGQRSTIMIVVAGPDFEGESDDPPTTEQTWDWADAGDVLARCTHRLVLIELYGRPHPHHERIEAFVSTLRAAVELTRPAAVWCPNSTRVVRPAEIAEDDLAALVNVRLFRIEDDGSSLMDTLGLNALGLPDVQCRFRDHEPNAIAAMLYDLAAYLVDRGDVIADGDTVGDLPWRCRDSTSLVGPERRVLDLREVR